MSNDAKVAGGLVAALGLGGAGMIDDCARVGMRSGSMFDDAARVGVAGSTLDDALRLGVRPGSTLDDTIRLGAGGSLDDAARLGVGGSLDDAARLGPAYRGRAQWGPNPSMRGGAAADGTFEGLPTLARESEPELRWFDAVESGTDLALDVLEVEDHELDLDAMAQIPLDRPTSTPPPMLMGMRSTAVLDDDTWRSPDTHLVVLYVDDASLRSLPLQQACVARGLRCAVVRCPEGDIDCRTVAQRAWVTVVAEAEATGSPQPEAWYLRRFAAQLGHAPYEGLTLEAVQTDGRTGSLVTAYPEDG